MLWSICYRGGTKKGATATITKMMPRQHIGSGSSWRYRRKRELCGCVKHARDGGVLPVTGFPRVRGMETRNVQRPLSNTVQTQATQTTHAFVPRTSSRVIPSRRDFSERIKFVEGSSGTHCLVESTATVVVHSTVFGNGRRTRFLDIRVFCRGTWRIPDV